MSASCMLVAMTVSTSSSPVSFRKASASRISSISVVAGSVPRISATSRNVLPT